MGHGDMFQLLMALRRELERAGLGVGAICVVDCEQPLDFASTSAHTILWSLNDRTGQIERAAEGTLSEVNAVAAALDRQIARRMLGEEEGEGSVQIDALVSISSDVEGVNFKTIAAAARRRIPVTGTGGTSLGRAAAMGVRLVGACGGSVSTTVDSRALAFASGLAGYWRLGYEPTPTSVSLHGILAAAWPAFVAVTIAHRAAAALAAAAAAALPPKVLGRLHRLFPWLDLAATADLSPALPLVVAVVAAAHVARLGETALIAGLLAATLACSSASGGSTVLCGLLAGCLAGWLCRRFLVGLARSNLVPATAASILTAGVAGIVAGVVGLLLLREPCRFTSHILLTVLDWLEAPSADGRVTLVHGLLGSVVGAAMAWGSQRGWYHRLTLPVIMLEMERGQPSLLGAVDWCSLCLSSGGICLAAWLLPPPPNAFPSGGGVPTAITLDPRPLARRGVFVNMLWGDWVEVCYPFLTIPLIRVAYYAGSMASSALLLSMGVKSCAYLPFPISWWLARPADATPAALVGFGVPFAATLLVSIVHRLF